MHFIRIRDYAINLDVVAHIRFYRDGGGGMHADVVFAGTERTESEQLSILDLHLEGDDALQLQRYVEHHAAQAPE